MVIIVLPNGDILHRPHFCQNWSCVQPDCRKYKAEKYINDPRALSYKWMGFVGPKNREAVKKQGTRLNAVQLTATFLDSDDRLVISDVDIGGRNHLLKQLPLATILGQLRTQLTTRPVKRVSPQPVPGKKEMTWICRGSALKQTKVLTSYGFIPKDNPAFWKRPDGWDKEYTIETLKGEFGAAKLVAA